MFIGGTHPTTPPKPTMPAINSDVAALQIQLKEVLETVSNIESQIKTLTEAEEFDVFMLNEMTPIFGEKTSRNILKVLQKCRTEDHNYHHFSPVYQWAAVKGKNDDEKLENRQLLKLISATYRVKYARNACGNVYSLRSEIKYAKACPHCGKVASAFYDRLVKEGKI